MLFVLKGLRTYTIDYSCVLLLHVIIGGIADIFSLVGLSFDVTFQQEFNGNLTLNDTVEDFTDVFYESIREENVLLNDTHRNSTDVRQNLVCFVQGKYFYVYLMIPSVMILALYSFLTKRKECCERCCNGRPGLAIPVDLLTDHEDRLGYAFAFGAISLNVFELFIGKRYFDFGDTTTSAWSQVYVTAVHVLYVGVWNYPYFTSIGYPNKLFGSIVGLCHGAIDYLIFGGLQLLFCDEFQVELGPEILRGTKAVQVIMAVTQVFWACYYIRLILIIVREVVRKLHKRTAVRKPTFKDLAESIYVKHLFKRRVGHRVKGKYGIKCIWQYVASLLYKPVPGFKYSTRMLATFVIAANSMLMLGSLEMIHLKPIEPYIGMFARVVALRHISSKGTGEIDDTEKEQYTVQLGHDLSYNIFVIMYVSVTAGTVVTVMFMFKTLANYRNHLLMLFRGERSFLPLTQTSPSVAMVCCLKYSGFQVGFTLWAFLLLQMSFASVIFLVWYQIVLPIKYGIDSNFFSRIDLIWQGGTFGVLVYILQLALSHYVFLQDRGHTVCVNNRRWFHVSSFFLIFYNVVLGTFTCISRFFRSLVLGVIFLGRLDQGTLPRNYELWDPGYRAYVGFLIVEEAHCHPVMVTFCRLLQRSRQKETSNLQGTKAVEMLKYQRHRRARRRWLVAYTILRNPSLRCLRSPKSDSQVVNECLCLF